MMDLDATTSASALATVHSSDESAAKRRRQRADTGPGDALTSTKATKRCGRTGNARRKLKKQQRRDQDR